ncbi:MAG: hypothetical protein ACO1N5_13600 [Noviherbaspirillum sp.]
MDLVWSDARINIVKFVPMHFFKWHMVRTAFHEIGFGKIFFAAMAETGGWTASRPPPFQHFFLHTAKTGKEEAREGCQGLNLEPGCAVDLTISRIPLK